MSSTRIVSRPHQLWPSTTSWGHLLRPPSRRRMVLRKVGDVNATFGFDSMLPALNVAPEYAVLASATLATSSVVINYFSGLQLERQRGEMALELERDKSFQQQLRELQGVIARYRGPLLESAIDLEQRLWHLVTDQCFDRWDGTETRLEEEVRYLMFTMAQFLGFVEVVRREGPRERPFLQAGNPQGSDTLNTLVEGIRFILCASPTTLEEWYMEGPGRKHPGARRRRDVSQVLNKIGELESCPVGSLFYDPPLFRVSRGQQRAIGTLMITTPMGAERHYTMSYGDFHCKLDTDSGFSRWFADMEKDARELATGAVWAGETSFPCGRWSRVLLLQQMLVELMDVLDPDCVRLSLDRRQRLMPVKYGQLPSVSAYQKGLQQLGSAVDFGMHQSALEGLKDLMKIENLDDIPPPASPLKFKNGKKNKKKSNGNGASSTSSQKAPVLVAAGSSNIPTAVENYGENSDAE